MSRKFRILLHVSYNDGTSKTQRSAAGAVIIRPDEAEVIQKAFLKAHLGDNLHDSLFVEELNVSHVSTLHGNGVVKDRFDSLHGFRG